VLNTKEDNLNSLDN